MKPRMKNPALILPGANEGIQGLLGAIFQSGVPKEVFELTSLRVGQLNVCELCIGQAMAGLEPGSERAKRINSVANWQSSDCFSDQERTALALAEAMTALNGRYDSVPDTLWNDVERLYSESARAGLVLFISAMNMFTRINVSTRQITPDWQT